MTFQGDYGTVPFLIAAQAKIDPQPLPATIKGATSN